MLALKLGQPSIRTMLNSMSSEELLDWQAYFDLSYEAEHGPAPTQPRVAIPAKDGNPVEPNAVKLGMQAMFGNRVRRKKPSGAAE